MNLFNAKEGCLLIATGEKHRLEAIKNVAHMRHFINNRPIFLVTDDSTEVPYGLFDKIIKHPNAIGSYRDKIEPLLNLPFQRTLFLDTDLEIIQPIDDIFKILKELDVVGCHAPVRWCQWKDPVIPEGFCELNSGVIGLRRSRRVKILIKRWLKIYDIAGVTFDQASLRSALNISCGAWSAIPLQNDHTR